MKKWICPVCGNEFDKNEMDEDWEVRGFCNCVEEK